MKIAFRWMLIPFAFSLVLAIAYSPLPIPTDLDFLALYHANLGVLRGVPLYDLTGQVNMTAELVNVSTEHVSSLPFVHPPWYALLTLPLALFSIGVAARFWFVLNLLIVIVFVWLVTGGWPTFRRSVSFFLATLFLPVLGALYVGSLCFRFCWGLVYWFMPCHANEFG